MTPSARTSDLNPADEGKTANPQKRIYELEQALDQAMLYLEELRQQNQCHSDLEVQLAMAEDYTYVQERAIASLKAQLKALQQSTSQRSAPPGSSRGLEDRSVSSPEPAEDGNPVSRYPASPIDRDAARWRQQILELQTDCATHHHRCEALEEQVSELQEQVFRQAKQASEYETAVHFWKARCRFNQQQIDKIKLSLGSEATCLPTEAAAALQVLLAALDLDPEPHTPEPIAQLELPDFLIRRHYYRNRQLLWDSKFG
ncbi:MAG: hypothetical protein ACFB5Z_06710 [Elainellaceae cyanobacterium]